MTALKKKRRFRASVRFWLQSSKQEKKLNWENCNDKCFQWPIRRVFFTVNEWFPLTTFGVVCIWFLFLVDIHVLLVAFVVLVLFCVIFVCLLFWDVVVDVLVLFLLFANVVWFVPNPV